MLLSKLSGNWKLAATSNRILLFCNLFLSVALLIAVSAAASNRERITVVPPTVDKPLTIGWNSATTEYYKSMALYFSGVMGMAGPRNLTYVIGVIERFAAPPIAEGIKSKLRLQASSYEFRNSTATSWFEGHDIVWESQTSKVFVLGALKMVSSNKQEVSQSVVYEYMIGVEEGRPVINHFDSYAGDQAHTLAFFADKKRLEADKKRLEDAVKESLGTNIIAPEVTPVPKKN